MRAHKRKKMGIRSKEIKTPNKLLLIGFDNTLIKNPYDVDLTKNLNLFLETWQGLKTEPVSQALIDWLKGYEFILFTNRGIETKEKIKEHLKELGLYENCKGMIFCEGNKENILKALRQAKNELVLIDNARKYIPYLLVDANICKRDLNYLEKMAML